MQAVYHYNMALAFPVGEKATFAHIAEKCDLNEADLRRLLRHAISYRMFKEVEQRVVAHTALWKIMAEDAISRDYVGIGSDDM